MDIEVIKNIFLLFVIIVLFLLLSNNKKYNELLNKNKFNYLILLIIVYFVYIEVPLIIIVILLLIFLFLNKHLYNKYLKQNQYLKDLLPNIESFENNEEVDFIPYESNEEHKDESISKSMNHNDTKSNSESKNNKENSDENNIKEIIKMVSDSTEYENNKTYTEPFKDKVLNIKQHLNNALNISH